MTNFCKVCITGKIIQGFLFCEACRSFYRRNQSNSVEDFECKRGDYNCDLASKDCRTSQGSVYRFLCKACRLKKAFELARPCNRSNNVNIDIPTEGCGEMENVLKLLMKSKSNLSTNMENCPFRTLVANFPKSSDQGWMIFMNIFPNFIVNVKTYGRIFPIFSQFSIQDRITMILKTRFAVLAGEGLLYPNDFYVTGINSDEIKALQKRCITGRPYGRILSTIRVQAEKSWIQLQNMKLTNVEQAFFLAFLFFSGNSYSFCQMFSLKLIFFRLFL